MRRKSFPELQGRTRPVRSVSQIRVRSRSCAVPQASRTRKAGIRALLSEVLYFPIASRMSSCARRNRARLVSPRCNGVTTPHEPLRENGERERDLCRAQPSCSRCFLDSPRPTSALGARYTLQDHREGASPREFTPASATRRPTFDMDPSHLRSPVLWVKGPNGSVQDADIVTVLGECLRVRLDLDRRSGEGQQEPLDENSDRVRS